MVCCRFSLKINPFILGACSTPQLGIKSLVRVSVSLIFPKDLLNRQIYIYIILFIVIIIYYYYYHYYYIYIYKIVQDSPKHGSNISINPVFILV